MVEYTIQNLTLIRAQRTLIQGLSLELERGQCWGVLGPNGAGKTTLLHTMAGLHQAAAGALLIQHTALHQFIHMERARRLGLLFQHNPNPFPATVEETVVQGRHPYLRPWQWESDEDMGLARAALKQVGMEALSHRQVDSLSGGERQRLAIATLLTQDPITLLLDEPINHLDLHQQIRVLELFRKKARSGAHLVVMAMHDINLAQRYCDHILLIYPNGKVILGETSKVLTRQNLSLLYGHSMLQIEGPHGPLYVPE